MNIKLLKGILYLVVLLINISISLAGNTTMQQLIDSFDYNYYSGNLNVTNQTDYMIDRNGNGLNDTLMINITTNNATSDNYTFIIELIDKNGILVNDTTIYINATNNYAIISFSTEFLSQNKFNYTITINDVNGTLIFRKYKIETNTYLSYETGTNITKITDENVNNNLIRINLTINSTQAITANITVTLAYNSSKISKTEEKTLVNGLQVVSINFDNETIKSTHYVGKSGTFALTATVTNSTYSDSKSITLDVKHIEAYNLTIVNESGSKRIFEFVVKNNLNSNLTNVNWTFDTKNSNVINSTTASILQPAEQIFDSNNNWIIIKM